MDVSCSFPTWCTLSLYRHGSEDTASIDRAVIRELTSLLREYIKTVISMTLGLLDVRNCGGDQISVSWRCNVAGPLRILETAKPYLPITLKAKAIKRYMTDAIAIIEHDRQKPLKGRHVFLAGIRESLRIAHDLVPENVLLIVPKGDKRGHAQPRRSEIFVGRGLGASLAEAERLLDDDVVLDPFDSALLPLEQDIDDDQEQYENDVELLEEAKVEQADKIDDIVYEDKLWARFEGDAGGALAGDIAATVDELAEEAGEDTEDMEDAEEYANLGRSTGINFLEDVSDEEEDEDDEDVLGVGAQEGDHSGVQRPLASMSPAPTSPGREQTVAASETSALPKSRKPARSQKGAFRTKEYITDSEDEE